MTDNCITTAIDLLGPNRISGIFPNVYGWPGPGSTARLAQFRFEHPHMRLANAHWRVVWSVRTPQGAYNPPTQNVLKLFSVKPDGAGVLIPIGWLNSCNFVSNISIHNVGVDITAALNTLVDAGNYEQVGWHICGDTANIVEIEACRLELTWEIGDARVSALEARLADCECRIDALTPAV